MCVYIYIFIIIIFFSVEKCVRWGEALDTPAVPPQVEVYWDNPYHCRSEWFCQACFAQGYMSKLSSFSSLDGKRLTST